MLDAQNPIEIKAPHEAILDLPQERITGDILRGRGPRRGNLETLIKYWRPIMRKPGGFRRCLVILADHPELYPLERICAWLHHETTGMWPNEGNHHAGGKLGAIVKRTVKKGKRVRKKKDAIPGVDFPIHRVEMRIEQQNKSQMYAALDGTPEQMLWKAGKLRRAEQTVGSLLLPGEGGSFKPRHIIAGALTPGGSGLPGPGSKPARSRLGIRGGSATDRGFRCPSGFQHGGKFTDKGFTTCGAQLFAVPGSLAQNRTIVGAGNNRRTPGSVAAAGATPSPPSATGTQGKRLLPPQLGRPNPNLYASGITKTQKDSSAAPRTSPFRRIVRSDGSVIEPISSLEILAQQEDNPDLLNAAFVSNISGDGNIGAEEIELMKTGLKEISFALPGGGSATIERVSDGPMAPGDARSFGKAVTEAKKIQLPEMDLAGLLRETAARTDSANFSVEIPGVREELNRSVRVSREGSSRSVPLWVYRTFLSEDAPGRSPGAKPYKLLTSVKTTMVFEWKSARRDSDSQWGPLEYSATSIPTVGDSYHNHLKFKAIAWHAETQNASLALHEVKARAVWDIGIDRFRCPPGTPDAGQLTNRFGLGCAGGVVSRAARSAGRAVRGVDKPNVNVGSGSAPGNQPNVPGKRPKKPGKNRGKLLDIIANIIDPDGSPRKERRSSLLDRLADAFDPDVSKPKNPKGSLMQRIADIIDPDKSRRVRPYRERRIKFATEMPERKEARAILPSLLDTEQKELEKQWVGRLGTNKFDIDDGFDYIFNNREGMDPEEFRRLQTELYDIQEMNAIQREHRSAMPERMDQLSDERWELFLAKMRAEERILNDMDEAELAERKKANDLILAELETEKLAKIQAEKLAEAQQLFALGDTDALTVQRDRHKKRTEVADTEIDSLNAEQVEAIQQLVAERDNNQQITEAIDGLLNEGANAPDDIDTGEDVFDLNALPTLSAEEWRDVDPHALGWGEATKDPRYGMVIMDNEGRVLLRKPKDNYDGYHWTFPKGAPNKDEHPVDAAIREVGEETGLDVTPIDILPGKYDSDASSSFFFMGRANEENPALADGETEELRWATIEEARDLIGETTNEAGQKRDHDILDTAALKHSQMQLVAGNNDDYNPAKDTIALADEPDAPIEAPQEPRQKILTDKDLPIEQFGNENLEGYNDANAINEIVDDTDAHISTISKNELSKESHDWADTQDRMKTTYHEMQSAETGDEERAILKKAGYTDLEDFLLDYREASIKRWQYGGETRNNSKKGMPKNQPEYLAEHYNGEALEATLENLTDAKDLKAELVDEYLTDGKFDLYSDSLKDMEWIDWRIEQHGEAVKLREAIDLEAEKDLEAEAAAALGQAQAVEDTIVSDSDLKLSPFKSALNPIDKKDETLDVVNPGEIGVDDDFQAGSYAQSRYQTAIKNAEGIDTDMIKKHDELEGRINDLNKQIADAPDEEAKEALRTGTEAKKIYLQVEAYQFSLAMRERRSKGKLEADELVKGEPSLALLEEQRKANQDLVDNAKKHEPGLLDGGNLYNQAQAKQQYSFDLSTAEAKAKLDVLNKEITDRKAAMQKGLDAYDKLHTSKASLKDPAHHLLPPNDDGSLGHKWVDTSPIDEYDDAVQHLADGGEIMDVAEGLRRDAILENTGTGKRYNRLTAGSSINTIKGGKKHETVVVEDTTDPLGRKYVLKKPIRDDREYLREQAAQMLMQELGLPSAAIVLDGTTYDFDNGDHKGETVNRSMILEHLDNIVDLEHATGGEPLDMGSMAKLVYLDALMGEFDRHSENRIAYQLADGSQMILPIDQGKSFTPWDEDYTGKAAPLLNNSMGELVLSKIKTPEQKKAFARALRREMKNFDNSEFKKSLNKMSLDQAFDSDEREFVDNISDFIGGQVPLIEAQVDSFIDSLPGGDITASLKLTPEQEIQAKPSFVGKAIQGFKTKTQIPLSYFGYDGGEIKDSRVRVRKVRLQQQDGSVKGKLTTNSTEVSFKLRDAGLFPLVDRAMSDDSDGWVVESGMNVPTPAKTFKDKKVGFGGYDADTKVNSSGGITMRKQLDDGTVIYVYSNYTGGGSPTTSHIKNSFSGQVRIVNPGKTDEVLTDESVKTWMAAAGVKSHGPPTAEDIEEMASSKLAASLLGPHEFVAAGSLDNALEVVKQRYGITVDDVDVTVDSLGQIQVMLPEEALESIPELAEVGYTIHHNWNSYKSTDKAGERGAQWLLSGMLPTSDRWMTEINSSGGSSYDDSTQKGSGEFLFQYLHKGPEVKSLHKGMMADGTAVDTADSHELAMVYSPRHLLNLGFRLNSSDFFGDQDHTGDEKSYGIDAINKGYSSGIQFLSKGTVMPTKHDRMQVRSQIIKDKIIANLHGEGVGDIDGVPLDKFIIVG